MPTFLKTAFPIFRVIVEIVVGAFLLLATPAALYSVILDGPELGELNASVLRISLVLALGVGLWKDALYMCKQLRIDRAASSAASLIVRQQSPSTERLNEQVPTFAR